MRGDLFVAQPAAATRPPPLRAVVVLCLLLALAGALQGVLAPQARSLGGGQPDLVFTVALSAALLSDAGRGALIGFSGGLITAALVGQTVGTFLVSRTLGGFVAGWLTARLFRTNAGVVVLSVLAGSLAAEVVYLLAAPRTAAGLSAWIPATLIGAIWNAALAVPLTFLLRRLGWGQGGRP